MQEIEHKKGKIYYSMGEVAEMFDVNPSLLRYWEQEFDILKPHRNKKGNRLFTPKDVDNLRIIYHLVKERKMKIEVARKYIKDYRKEIDRDAEITEKSMNIRAMLRQIKQELAYDGQVVDEDMEYDDAEVFAVSAEENAEPKVVVEDAPRILEEQEATAVQKPPFEEQVLFDVAVPLEFVQGDAVPVDDGFASAMAAFENVHASLGQDEEPDEQNQKAQVIEQTLF